MVTARTPNGTTMATAESGALKLPIVDGYKLDSELRELLRPAELMEDREGRLRRLPRFFYRVDSWETALSTLLTPHFSLWEFLDVDLYEAEPLRVFPRYVPCAVSLLAAQLEMVRVAVDTYVHISANGGYRSPSHRLSTHATPHCWGTAANLYRVGDSYLDDENTIKRYNRIVRQVLPTVWVRSFGPGVGEVNDHVHLDLGYVTLVPRDAPSEDASTAAKRAENDRK